MEDKQEKKISKSWLIFAWIFALFVFAVAINSWKNATKDTTTSNSTVVEKSDLVQERIDRINELFIEDSAFEKVEKIDNSSLWIYFVSAPDEDIDTITRWQAVNLSNEVNGVASVKTFIWWTAQMFCTATKWQINNCSDYR